MSGPRNKRKRSGKDERLFSSSEEPGAKRQKKKANAASHRSSVHGKGKAEAKEIKAAPRSAALFAAPGSGSGSLPSLSVFPEPPPLKGTEQLDPDLYMKIKEEDHLSQIHLLLKKGDLEELKDYLNQDKCIRLYLILDAKLSRSKLAGLPSPLIFEHGQGSVQAAVRVLNELIESGPSIDDHIIREVFILQASRFQDNPRQLKEYLDTPHAHLLFEGVDMIIKERPTVPKGPGR
jgi:hypothetical protein